MTDTARPPARGTLKTIRFPKGSDLLPWYEQHADLLGITPNRALVSALERYRAEVDQPEEQQSA